MALFVSCLALSVTTASVFTILHQVDILKDLNAEAKTIIIEQVHENLLARMYFLQLTMVVYFRQRYLDVEFEADYASQLFSDEVHTVHTITHYNILYTLYTQYTL